MSPPHSTTSSSATTTIGTRQQNIAAQKHLDALELKYVTLEKGVACLLRKLEKMPRPQSTPDTDRVAALEQKVKDLEDLLKGYDIITRAAMHGYNATHDQARNDMDRFYELMGYEN